MLIDLTVRGPVGDRDVRVEATADTVFGAVRAGLAAAAGLPGDCRFFHDTTALTDDLVLTAAGVCTGAVLSTAPSPARGATSPYALQVTAGPAAGRVYPLHRGRVSIGRAAECDITLDDERISRRHVTLEVGAGRVTVLDHGSTNGTTVDGRPVPRTGTPLPAGAVLRVGDSLLSVSAPTVAAAAVSVADGAVLLHRPPRAPRHDGAATIVAPVAPARERPHPVQWLAALVPAGVAAGLAWLTGSRAFLLFGLLSPVLMLSTALGDRWHGRRARRRAEAAHRGARRTAASALAEELAAEAERRRAAHPDPAVVALTAATPGVELWARRPTDDDWLAVRIGCGSGVARTLVHEDGHDRPGGVLSGVPVVVGLRGRPLGLAGPAGVRSAMARWWVTQLAVHHSPEDLSILVCTADESWAWVRWLPHARVASGDGRDALVEQLGADVEHRLRRVDAGGAPPGPAVVVVVDGAGDPALAELVARGAAVGVTAVWLRTDPAALPAGCTTVLAGADGRAEIRDGGPLEAVSDLVADTVTTGWADRVARGLAPLVDADARRVGRLPDSCTLTRLLGLGAASPAEIAKAWAASDGRPDTAIGVTADGVLAVDLEADGPHALVAGTTGAGKSELLRTWVAGLCLLHPPEELSVLLIDYKGGAAFAGCAELPHCAGLVTDLDPHLTARALRSLDAEIRRRETLLHDAGAIDLQAYRATSPRSPLPRLVIVVDEFATLADELPDFVTGLVGVAQRGRSLGVHLILATQRPGAAVSPEIRANTTLRIALRVTGPGESVDVVGTDDAATIAPSTPGRAVLADGTGVRLFQAARPCPSPPVGAAPRVTPVAFWRDTTAGPGRRTVDARSGAGGLDALVTAVVDAARQTRRSSAPRPWLDPLPDVVTAPPLPTTTFALADLPDRQQQQVMAGTPDPAGSTLLLGTARSGRTTALAALALAAARTHHPAELELQVVDARGDLLALVADLPHVSSGLGPDGLDLTATLLERLAGATAPRRQLLLVDGWDVLVAALGDDAALEAEQRLTALVRAPGPVGVVVTGDRSLAAPRFSGAFDRRLALRLGERTDYGALGVSVRDLPVRFPPGRGVRADDGVEFQIAVPVPTGGGDRTQPVAELVHAAAAELAGRSSDGRPEGGVHVRPLPVSVSLDDVGPPATRLRIGVGGDDGSPVTLDPFAGSRRWLVCGPPRSGRSTVLCVALVEAARTGCPVVVAAPPRSPVAGLARRLGHRVLDPAGPAGSGPPQGPTLLLVDDTDAFVDTAVGDTLLAWIRDSRTQLAILAGGRPDELALAYRGIAAEVRRSRSGIALNPGPVDGELFGVRLPRTSRGDPPGRGRLITDPAWAFGASPIGSAGCARIQVATVGVPAGAQSMWG